MVETPSAHDVEKDLNDHSSGRGDPTPVLSSGKHIYRSFTVPFAGRLGGNQAFIVNRDDASNATTLQNVPDAAPGMTLAEQFDLRPFRTIWLWKAAALEGMGE